MEETALAGASLTAQNSNFLRLHRKVPPQQIPPSAEGLNSAQVQPTASRSKVCVCVCLRAQTCMVYSYVCLRGSSKPQQSQCFQLPAWLLPT